MMIKIFFLNARKSVLYHKNDVWEKQTGLFDITMGAFDGAQITDLVFHSETTVM